VLISSTLGLPKARLLLGPEVVNRVSARVPKQASFAVHFLADVYEEDGIGMHAMRVARMWSQSEDAGPDFRLNVAGTGDTTAKALCKRAVNALRKGSYLDGRELVELSMKAARAEEFTMTPEEFLALWEKDPDATWQQYFEDENGVGWPYWCLHELVAFAQTVEHAVAALTRWQGLHFVRAIHPVYHRRAQLVEKPFMSVYEKYDSREKLKCIHVMLALNGPEGDALRIYQELERDEPLFPKGRLAPAEQDPSLLSTCMRFTVYSELERMKCRPDKWLHPTGCFRLGYILDRMGGVPSSVFNPKNWRKEWGDRREALGPLADAIACAHHGSWEDAMRLLGEFFSRAEERGWPDNLTRDVAVGELCWKMVGFSQTIPQALGLLDLISARKLPFVCPIY
jgi:hypothetical protein